MDGRYISVDVRMVEVNEPPFMPRDYADLRLQCAMLALDIALLQAVKRVLMRVRLAAFVEFARKATLAGLTGYNGGLAIWNFAAFFVPTHVAPAPHIASVALGLLLAWAWVEFSAWWNRRGLDALLGL